MGQSIPVQERFQSLAGDDHGYLLLLDSNDPLNLPADRAITSELYGGNLETRLQQEMILGIGGWRALRAIGLHPGVCHLNEGHAAFALLERIRDHMIAGKPFEEALSIVKAATVFTTHTPVPAGNETYSPDEFGAVFQDMTSSLGTDLEGILRLGRIHPDDTNEPPGMTALAIRLSRHVNGVSRIHGEVTREELLARSRLLEAGGAVDYLLHYPYGCLEQTTSSMMPWFAVDALRPVVPRFAKVDEGRPMEAINAGVNRLRKIVK